jgi:hypothetical protein
MKGPKAEVLDWLGIPDVKRWKVEPLVVVNQELFTPFLRSSPMRVISYQQFSAHLALRLSGQAPDG